MKIKTKYVIKKEIMGRIRKENDEKRNKRKRKNERRSRGNDDIK